MVTASRRTFFAPNLAFGGSYLDKQWIIRSAWMAAYRHAWAFQNRISKGF